MVHVYCIFKKCGNQRNQNSRVSYFSFPKEKQLLQKWLDFVNQHNPTKLDEKKLDRDRMKICHMHFEKRQVQTKSNNDRVLVRNSVPRCPPGIVDKAHLMKKFKAKRKSKKQILPYTDKNHKNSDAAQNKAEEREPALEGNLPYHTISGYVVDLRIAAQQDTFRLPNGKLIQVRRQPKKAELSTKAPSSESAQNNASSTGSSSTLNRETEDKETSISDKNTSPHSDLLKSRPSKTYINRRTLNKSPQTTPPLPTATVSSPVEAMLSNPTVTSNSPTVSTRPPIVNETFSMQSMRPAIIVPPALASIQALMHKIHPDTPFGAHLKEFDRRLISTAELSLHILSKINTFLHSNPYRNAENIGNLKELYHHLAYILKYTMDQINGLEDNCAHDIQQMGFTKQADLGPLMPKQVDKSMSKSSDIDETEVAEEAKEAEVEEDDDCAIIEQRTDVIEVDSDDDEYKSDEDSEDTSIEPSVNTSRLQICSETESIGQHESSNDSLIMENSQTKTSSENIPQIEIPELLFGDNEETAKFEVVMNEVEETTIVQDYYTAEVSDDDDENDITTRRMNGVDGELIDLYEDEAGTEQTTPYGGDDTGELIEIIEGDIDLDMDDRLEYKVIEVIDGDCDMWTA